MTSKLIIGILYCLLVIVISTFSLAQVGSPDIECQNNGFDFGISKWEHNDTSGSYDQAEPDISGYTTSVTGNDMTANWTSSPAADGILSKEATNTFVHAGGTSGTVTKNGQNGISHITFCGSNETVGSCEENETFASCEGTPNICGFYDAQNSCESAGCSWGQSLIEQQIWTEDFSSSTDWATFAASGSGISYENSPSACINDDNDDCLLADGGSTPYFLAKQSSIDMSSCETGTGQFDIAKVRESGNLESIDCLYVWFSDDNGSTWGDRTTIFCDDNPASTFSTSIPDTYLVSGMRLRIEKAGFGEGGEEGSLDGFSITCNQSIDACMGSPNSCTTYNNEDSCVANGCGPVCEPQEPEAHFTIFKQVINNNTGNLTADDFTLRVNDSIVTSGVTYESSPGSYVVTEDFVEGYALVGFTGDCDGQGNLNLENGDNKTCTVINDDLDPSITVNKIVVNNDSGNLTVQDFSLFINNASVTSGVANELVPGNYTVSEIQQAGYTATFSGDCDADGNIELDFGQNKVCNITNDDVPEERVPVFAFKYEDLNMDGSGNFSGGENFLLGWEFILYDEFGAEVSSGTTGNTEATDNRSLVGEVSPGTYTVCETPQAGWINSDPGLGSDPDPENLTRPCEEFVVTENTNFINLFFGNYEESVPFCGDSIVNQNNETCDDGNNEDGDGCSSTCQIESSCEDCNTVPLFECSVAILMSDAQLMAKGYDNVIRLNDSYPDYTTIVSGERDIVFGTNGVNVINTDSGDDFICGFAGNDTINASTGDDVIFAGIGNDVIFAGSGDDFVDAGSGHDIVKAGVGSDCVYGGIGMDDVDGGSGVDFIDGGSGADTLRGGIAGDTIFGGIAADFIDGEGGADFLGGGAGDDNIEGGAGADTIDAGVGKDNITGEGGNDVIQGAFGVDIIDGGPGNNDKSDNDAADSSVTNVEDIGGAPPLNITLDLSMCAPDPQPFCGDGNLDDGESCDDQNHVDGDGCSSTCELEDGSITIVKSASPQDGTDFEFTNNTGQIFTLDDANPNDNDSFSNLQIFTLAPGGYNFWENVTEGWELVDIQCSDNNSFVNVSAGSIRVILDPAEQVTCTFFNRISAFCGDGQINQNFEQCDDGNNMDGDGCNAVCEIEFCGDGIVNNGVMAEYIIPISPEQCDDGNNEDGDGCSKACLIETPPMMGYGYGMYYGYPENLVTKVNFGYGYGYNYIPQYGYQKTYLSELAYLTEWDTTNYDPGLYEFRFFADAENDGTRFIFKTKDTLEIEIQAPEIPEVSEEDGNETNETQASGGTGSGTGSGGGSGSSNTPVASGGSGGGGGGSFSGSTSLESEKEELSLPSDIEVVREDLSGAGFDVEDELDNFVPTPAAAVAVTSTFSSALWIMVAVLVAVFALLLGFSLNKKGKSYRNIWSLLITVGIILTLVLIGPAAAVNLFIHSPSSTTPDSGDLVTFMVEVDIEAEEILPVKAVILEVNGIECKFKVQGGKSLTNNPICDGFTLVRQRNHFYSTDAPKYGYENLMNGVYTCDDYMRMGYAPTYEIMEMCPDFGYMTQIDPPSLDIN